MRFVRPVVAAFAVGAVLLASGCGSSGDPLKGKSGDEIVSQAKQSLTNAKSVHMAGTIGDSDGEVTLDLTITQTGNAEGSMTLEGSKVNVVKTSDAMYLKADADFWNKATGQDAVGKLVAGKWLKVPADASSEFGDLSSFTNLKDFADQFTVTDPTRRDGTTDVNGTKTVVVEGKNSDDETVVIYVEDTKDAKPVRIEPGKDVDAKGHIDFSDWDKNADIKAPSDAVDLSSLAGAGGS